MTAATVPVKQQTIIANPEGQRFIIVDDSVVFFKSREGDIFHVMTLKATPGKQAEHVEALVKRWANAELPGTFWKVWIAFLGATSRCSEGRPEANRIADQAGVKLEWPLIGPPKILHRMKEIDLTELF